MVFAFNPTESDRLGNLVGKQDANNLLSRGKIYLREANEYVGPFCRREDAEQFLMLMKLFGVSCEEIEVLESGSDCGQMERRHCNLS